ncbi:MAG: serine hydrolase domain-containing protein [Hyphococcus sp.]
MSIARIVLIVLAALLAALVWLMWPVYGFFAHNKDAPLPPFGWVEMDEAAPVTLDALDPAFAEAGKTVIARLDARRKAIGAPAFSAAVAIDGEIVWRGAVGWADIAADRPATPETQFRIGSTSKAVTAMALARLVDRGVIDLDAPITDYLGEIRNPDWAKITPRMLASHMAGMPHYKENGERGGLYHSIALRRHYADVRDAVALFDESPLLSEPGTEFFYSSLGTVLLGAVMSEAAGKPYRQIIAEEVLAPARAASTIVAPKRPGRKDALATFYLAHDGRHRPWRPVDLSHRLPGGGWASTPSDLVRMGSLMLDPDYVSAGTREAFWTPQRLANGAVNAQGYAIGWRWREWDVEGVGVARNANHGGVSRGSQSWLLVFPDYGMAIAFNINSRTDEFHEFGMAWEDIFREFALAMTPPAGP